MFTETARAKINLNLHVGKVVEDPASDYHGYHPLSSLVAFADYGDELSCDISDKTTLQISGPFSKGLETDNSNLILKAYRAVENRIDLPNLRFSLVKNLPLAAGIGGGSADAAAALRLLKNYAELPDHIWLDIAKSLGADVPVCLLSKTCVMTGIGEHIEERPEMGCEPAILVNPGQAVSTGEVFSRFDQQNSGNDLAQPSGKSLIEMASSGRNDLADVAKNICPEIDVVIRELTSCFDCQAANLSGSGATCIGIFGNLETRDDAVSALWQNYTDWWVQPVMLGDQE